MFLTLDTNNRQQYKETYTSIETYQTGQEEEFLSLLIFKELFFSWLSSTNTNLWRKFSDTLLSFWHRTFRKSHSRHNKGLVSWQVVLPQKQTSYRSTARLIVATVTSISTVKTDCWSEIRGRQCGVQTEKLREIIFNCHYLHLTLI